MDVNAIKVKLVDVRFGTDGKNLTWGTAEAVVFDPRYGDEDSIGKVRATVRLHEGDTFDEKTGRKLVRNIMQRKAIERYMKQTIAAHNKLVVRLNETLDVLTKLDAERQVLKTDFKTLA